MGSTENIRIVGFDPAYAGAFADLNYEWIEGNYGIEPHDRELLDHPFDNIIAPGGEIFFALSGEETVGTAALIRTSETTFELAKMAVAPDFRGRGIGDLLIKACIDHAIRHRVPRMILESNTKQAAAIRMYRKHGFIEIPLDPNSHFSRANIRMELAITLPNR